MMSNKCVKSSFWDTYSILIVFIYFLLQFIRWRILPQFLDMYYHILTAWGFIQAGGYSGWDFWQYAPVGRPHIYPPFFHIITAIFMKLGFDSIIIAKIFETAVPALFLITLWYFMRKNYSKSLGFFTLVILSASFSFYLSLLNHIPATLALILGLLVLDNLLQNKGLRAALLLSLCFYTHIGVSVFIALSVLFYGLFNRYCRKPCFAILIVSLILSLPMLFRQITNLKFISTGQLNEKYFSEFKTIEYLMLLAGFIIIFKRGQKWLLFLSLFLASFIFLFYPYRFFCAQGYFPVILISAVSFDALWNNLANKRKIIRCLSFILGFYLLFLSPTILMEKPKEDKKVIRKLYLFDSAFLNMVFPSRNQRITSISLWHPDEYLAGREIIRQNSQSKDIIYSNLDILGLCLGSISGRATANALLMEVAPLKRFDPVAGSKIIVLTQDEDYNTVERMVNYYNLTKIGQSKIFTLYRNNLCRDTVHIKRASIPFWLMGLISFIFLILFFKAR